MIPAAVVVEASDMHVKKVTKKDRYGNSVTTEYEVPEKSIDPTRLMEKRMELDQPDMEIEMMSMPVGGEEFNMGDPNNHPGEPRGQDTVPAWLTPGEFVVNAEAMSVPGMAQQVEEINNVGRMMKEGGMVPQQHHRMPGGHMMAGETHYNEGGWMSGLTDFANKYILGEKTQIPVAAEAEAPAVVPTPAPVPVPNMPVPIDPTTALLHAREGYKDEVYLDSLGKPTVGYGHLLGDEYADRVGEKPFTEDQLKKFFEEDREKAIQAARENVGEDVYNSLNRQQQTALNSMAFQLGAGGQKKFKKMIEALKAGDHGAVAREALTGSKGGKSKWYKQTPKRAMDLAMAFDPDMAARYKNAGGVVYRDDGGWGSWLKNAANKYVLGEKTQIPTAEMPFGWNTAEGRPATREEGIGMGTVPVAPPSMMHGAAQDIPTPETKAIDQLYERAQGGDEYAAQILEDNQVNPETGLDMSPSEIADLETMQSAEYQAMLGRAASTGEVPDSPEEWREKNTRDESGQSEIDRFAPYSETVGQTAAAEVLEAGGDTQTADEAAVAADEALAGGATEEEATEAGVNKAANDDAARDALIQASIDDNEQAMINEAYGGDRNKWEKDQAAARKKVEEKGKSDPEALNEAKSILAEMGLDQLFDKKELARMAVMYAGSRLLGHSHHGSLNWAAKNYIGRVDAKQAAFNKIAMTGKYTKESLQKYRKTGNILDLQGVGVQPEATGEFKEFYKDGQRVNAQKIKRGDQTVWVTPSGDAIDATWSDDGSRVPGTKAYNDRIRGDMGPLNDAFKEMQGRFGEIPSKDKYGKSTFRTDLTGSRVSQQTAEWAAKNGVDVAQAGILMEQAYKMALADAATNPELRVQSITPYLNRLQIKQNTQLDNLFDMPDGKAMGAEKVEALAQSAAQRMGQDVSPTFRNQFWSMAASKWNNLDPQTKAEYEREGKRHGVTGFYQYTQQQLNS